MTIFRPVNHQILNPRKCCCCGCRRCDGTRFSFTKKGEESTRKMIRLPAGGLQDSFLLCFTLCVQMAATSVDCGFSEGTRERRKAVSCHEMTFNWEIRNDVKQPFVIIALFFIHARLVLADFTESIALHPASAVDQRNRPVILYDADRFSGSPLRQFCIASDAMVA